MWHHENQTIEAVPEGAVGFIYKIVNLSSGRYYYGQKKCVTQVTRPPLKGMKRKRRTLKESDWRSYYGSNEELKSDVLMLGPENFERVILKWCSSKGEMNYEESKMILMTDALKDPMSYNKYVACRINSNQVGTKK